MGSRVAVSVVLHGNVVVSYDAARISPRHWCALRGRLQMPKIELVCLLAVRNEHSDQPVSLDSVNRIVGASVARDVSST